MVRRQLKRQRTPDFKPATAAGNENASTQLDLYRILTGKANLTYACPLCLEPYSRYDHLYDHFKETEEEHHRELQGLWFSGQCTVCHEPSGQAAFKHSNSRHPESYQILMKYTLRMRPEVEVTIPAAPRCFRHEFFFPLRQTTSIIYCPPKKRKTAKDTARQEVDGNQKAGFNIGRSPLPGMGPADQDSRPLPAHDPLLYTEMHGNLFDSGTNLEPRYPAVSEPPTMPMESCHEHNQGDVSLCYRGSMTLLDTQWPIDLNDTCHFAGGNIQNLGSDADTVHVRRS